jgi:1-acyl-sn-glycerol-3-phosphate acyltransferase
MAEQRMMTVYAVSRLLFKAGLKLFHRFRVEGLEHVPRTGGALIACNHVSFLDPLAVGSAVPFRQTFFMARDTLCQHRFSGWWMRQVGVIPIDRSRGDLHALKNAIRFLSSGRLVALFPEGTRSPDSRLQEPKGGIGFLMHKAGVPVIPAYISGSYEAWPKAGRWRSAPVRIRFGRPIEPHEFTDLGGGREGYARAASLVMHRIAQTGAVRPPEAGQPFEGLRA